MSESSVSEPLPETTPRLPIAPSPFPGDPLCTASGLRETETRPPIAELPGELAYILIHEPDGASYVEWVSEIVQRATGLQPGMTESDLLERLTHPDDSERVSEWACAVRTGHSKPCEHRMHGHRAFLYWVNHIARITPLGDGSLRVDGELSDITEGKLAEHALLESESRYRALAEHASDIICELDGDQRIMFLNRAVEEILGHRPEDLIGMTLWDLVEKLGGVHPEDAPTLLERVGYAANAEVPMRHRVRMRHIQGSWRWIEFHGAAFRTVNGTAHRVVVGRDVSELLRREEEQSQYAERLEREVRRRTEALAQANDELRRLQLRLVYAERLGAAEELAARMAHAVNNPLAALLGTIEMEIESASGHNPRLTQMRRLAQRIRDVLENTLDLVREGNLKLADEDPARLLEEVRCELVERAERAGNRIEIEVQPDLPLLSVDRALLGAALVSVAENGLEAMEERGGGTLILQAVTEADMLRFLVKDQGPGIPADVQKRIFEPFFTTKSSGTGLGLPIAQGIVRGHGGRLSLCNRAEGGTLAVVTLPLSSSGPAPLTRGMHR